MKVTNNALEIIEFLVGKDSQMQQMVTESYLNAEVCQLIYETRIKAELTQKKLADMIGIDASILADLEEGDYEGNALIILHKKLRQLRAEREKTRLNESELSN